MRKGIAFVAAVAVIAGTYALIEGAAAPVGKTPQKAQHKTQQTTQQKTQQTTQQSTSTVSTIRKAAAKDPLDALSLAQGHAAVAHRSALARDPKATAKALTDVLVDLESARPAVQRLDGEFATELLAIKSAVESVRKRSGSDTGAVVPDIAKVFKNVKQLQAKVAGYSLPETPSKVAQPAKSGQTTEQPPRR